MNFWSILNSPDNFSANPYGELTNQLGHTMLGIIMTLAAVCVWREAAGDMPYRWHVFSVVVLSYIILVEVLSQGWMPGDSWFDATMVSFGSAGVLFPFKEAGVTGGITLLSLDHVILTWIMAAWAVVLTARVARRIRRASV